MEITANKRIASISEFYAKDTSNSRNVIEEVLKVKKATDDIKGVWVTEQFRNAAVTLHVMKFIEPLDR